MSPRYGMKMEERKKHEYITHQKCMGHPGLTVDSAWLFVSPANPWIAASPNGLIQNPTNASHPQGIEINNPYSTWDRSLKEACTNSNFCLKNPTQEKGGKAMCRLKPGHDYYNQMQCADWSKNMTITTNCNVRCTVQAGTGVPLYCGQINKYTFIVFTRAWTGGMDKWQDYNHFILTPF